MNDIIALLNAKIAERRRQFEQNLPGRLDTIAATLEQARSGGGAASAELHRQFHSLVGIAGTYGLTAIAATAHQAEVVCVDLSFHEDTFARVGSLLSEIRLVAAGQVAA
jgi:HPt (histidine-containing phosphotransfer) domain-containing protein